MFKMKKSFIVYYVFSCTLYKWEISFIFPIASPLVLNFCTIMMVSWSFIIG